MNEFPSAPEQKNMTHPQKKKIQDGRQDIIKYDSTKDDDLTQDFI